MPRRGSDLTGHTGNDEIQTPRALFDWLDRRFRFTYDAAASHENALCRTYSTIEGTFRKGQPYGNVGSVNPPWPLGGGDGLICSWEYETVFCNPPYSTTLMRAFIEKAIEERNAVRQAVLLVKYDSSTKAAAMLREHFHLEYLPRVKYEGIDHPATFASVIAIVKPDLWHPA